jgi:8-oxo-dGTP pyrophosphatase MutT (NUDIX family)
MILATPELPTCAMVGAAGLLLRRVVDGQNRWLLLKASKHGEWGFPKGHQNAGETPLQTAIRECAEECGIALVAIEGPPLEATYLLPSGRAKRVVYFPALTSEFAVHLSHEHLNHAWLSASGVINRLGHANLVLLFRAYLHTLPR